MYKIKYYGVMKIINSCRIVYIVWFYFKGDSNRINISMFTEGK